MDNVLRSVGNAFLSVANAVNEGKNAIHAYLFDLAFEDDHSKQGNDPVIPSPPSNAPRTGSQIIIFPGSGRSAYDSRIRGRNLRF